MNEKELHRTQVLKEVFEKRLKISKLTAKAPARVAMFYQRRNIFKEIQLKKQL